MYIHDHTFMRDYVIERKKRAVATEQKNQPSEKTQALVAFKDTEGSFGFFT